MNIKDLVKDELGEVGSAIGGLVGGAVFGTLEAAVLPSYLHSKKNNAAYATSIPSRPEEFAKIEDKFDSRVNAYLTLTRPVFRYGAVVAMIADLADGTAENFGYLAGTMAVSLGSEVVGAAWKWYSNRVPSQLF